MFTNIKAYSGFSVSDLAEAKKFYGEVLGLDIAEKGPGLMINIAGSNGVLMYPKPDHIAATYTILNFPVADIGKAVQELKSKGVNPEQYEGLTDDNGIARGLAQQRGPDIAWFKDPSGNIFSVLKEG